MIIPNSEDLLVTGSHMDEESGLLSNHILRLVSDPGGRSIKEVKVLLPLKEFTSPSHQIQQIVQGLDGKLYVSVGDAETKTTRGCPVTMSMPMEFARYLTLTSIPSLVSFMRVAIVIISTGSSGYFVVPAIAGMETGIASGQVPNSRLRKCNDILPNKHQLSKNISFQTV